jgi:hypothetical protein
MTLLEFSKGLEGKDIDKLIHEAKAESENRILHHKGKSISCSKMRNCNGRKVTLQARGRNTTPLPRLHHSDCIP